MPFVLLSSAGTGGVRGVHAGTVVTPGAGFMSPAEARTKSRPPSVPGEKLASAFERSIRPSRPSSDGTHCCVPVKLHCFAIVTSALSGSEPVGHDGVTVGVGFVQNALASAV